MATDNERVVIVIPSRNEIYTQKTITMALKRAEGDLEIIAVLDGWDTPIVQEDKNSPEYDARVRVIRNKESIGQRASTNLGARESDAKYFIKADGHVLFDQGFDVKLKADFEPDWTVMPQMYVLDCEEVLNLCPACNQRLNINPDKKTGKFNCGPCKKSYNPEEIKHESNPEYWQPKWHRSMDFMYISNEPGLVHRAQYWHRFKRRPEAKQDLIEVMTGQGAVWFQDRQRYLDMGGLDEAHGSWGQVGMEVACKAWLSGGRHLINKKTWFAHWFRVGGVDFPYPIRQSEMNYARDYSRDFWRSGKWDKQVRPLSWLVRKFWPVPTWTEDAINQLDQGLHKKAVIYYTDSALDEKLAQQVRDRLTEAAEELPIISVSQKPLDFGTNICVGDIGRSHLSMFKQIRAGLAEAKKMNIDIVFLAEHDCLYHPSHFHTHLNNEQMFCYNNNFWYGHLYGKTKDKYSKPNQPRKLMSQLLTGRAILEKAIDERIAVLEAGLEMPRGIVGICEPGANEQVLKEKLLQQCQDKGIDPSFMDNFFAWSAEEYVSPTPNIDLRHGHNLSGSRLGDNVSKIVAQWGRLDHALQGISYRATHSKWYQPMTFNGVPMPQRFSKAHISEFYGQKKWDNFIEPLLGSLGDCKSRTFIEQGCNAGLYLANAAQWGFDRVIGIEPNETYLEQGRYHLSHYDYANIQLLKGDATATRNLPIADITLLANVLCWIETKESQAYIDKMAHKSLCVLVVSRDKPSRRFKSDARRVAVEEQFSQNWELIDSVDRIGVTDDPGQTPMYSLLFQSKEIRSYDVKELYEHPDFQDKAVYREAYENYIERLIGGNGFDVKDTEFYEYVKARGKWGKEPSVRARKWGRLALDYKDVGQKVPIEMKDGTIEHGLHRLIAAKHFRHQRIFGYEH